VAALGNRPRPTRHGVEPEFGKFWATNEDDGSSLDSEVEPDVTTPTLKGRNSPSRLLNG
jgi:hypothetical protein